MSSIIKGIIAEENKKFFIENENRQYELQSAFQQAKNITKQIKYDRTVGQILTDIELLVEKYNIDKDEFQVVQTEVINAQRQLEAAIYELDKLFEDAMKKAQWNSDEINNEGQIYSTGGGAGEGRRKYRIKPAGQFESKGLPMPGTYEQEYNMFKRKGPRKIIAMTNEEQIEEKWSDKYKRSINCNNPKGFSQRAHCQGRKKK